MGGNYRPGVSFMCQAVADRMGIALSAGDVCFGLEANRLSLTSDDVRRRGMPVHGVDHINIRTADLDRCRAFYCDVLGFEDGWRPPFESPGAWLYAGRAPLLHVTVTDDPRTGESAVDHVAFAVKGYDEITKWLGKRDIAFESHGVPETLIHQVFIEDPDGVSVELNFADGT